MADARREALVGIDWQSSSVDDDGIYRKALDLGRA